ncbi:MAG: hypothetical protein JWO75_5460, partial [Actinomycetia bacterium]|nr:hypothetical protein [Actinomycetes bacterium]
ARVAAADAGLAAAPVAAGALLELAEELHAAVRAANATAVAAVKAARTPRCAVNLARIMRTPRSSFTTMRHF